jgi:periplasmic nitrate reductase NapE
MSQSHDLSVKRRERAAFLLLTAVVFPALTLLLVAGYGFLVWAWQMVAGPPTGH